MSYTDKCCGVCDEYQDLWDTGKQIFYKYTNESCEKLLRFHDDHTNVCQACIHTKKLGGINVESLTLHKRMCGSENITKGRSHFIDPNGTLWSCQNNRLSVEELLEEGLKPKFSMNSPRYYEVTGASIVHTGLFSAGGIWCKDKRKLRKVLRKLGVTGNIKKLIK